MMTRSQQSRAYHRQRKAAKARVEAARYVDGNGKQRAIIARAQAVMRRGRRLEK